MTLYSAIMLIDGLTGLKTPVDDAGCTAADFCSRTRAKTSRHVVDSLYFIYLR